MTHTTIKPTARLTGPRVVLRPLERRDLPLTREWRNENRAWFFDDRVITDDMHQAWFAGYLQRSNDIVFVIHRSGDDEHPVGQIALYDIEQTAGTAECGRLIIGPRDARGAGFASEAIRLVADWAFGTLGLSEVVAHVRDTNMASLRAFVHAGFAHRATRGTTVVLCARATVPPTPEG